MAVIHYKETSLARYNPGNGQGVWQLYDLYQKGISFPPASSISEEEFLRQTKLFLEDELFAKVKDLDLSNEGDVKRLFFGYNGMADVYIRKALSMGFTQEEANNGEGSPYVMNGYDAPRDPFHADTMDPKWRGIFVGDGVYDAGALGYTYGAYTVYEAIGGAASGSCKSENLTGGLTKEQAKAFMDDYINNVNCSDWGVYCSHGSSTGPKGNCVTFVQYFLSRFTSAGAIQRTGDGGWVVSNLTGTDVSSPFGAYPHQLDYSDKGFIYGGTQPKPFAVFSTGHGSTYCGAVKCGHTGIVLGINEASNEIYIGQAGYDTPLVGYSDIVVYPLSDYTNGEYWYAYTDGMVKTDELEKVINNK